MRKRAALYYENKLSKQGYDSIIGVDEAGRGPLAGPVVAAAVLIKNRRFKNRIDDSKKLSPARRRKAFSEIKNNSVFAVACVGHKEIDRINILRACELAMQKALSSLSSKLKTRKSGRLNAFVIVDGKMRLDIKLPYRGIIKGDAKSQSIAAASILAKVSRDRMMDAFHKLYPQYGFIRHKGYPTKEHFSLLKKIGPCLIHRKSFLKCLET